MKTLLHICCANCAIYPVKTLRGRGGELTGYFFNHNIHPYQEFRRRLDAVQQYAGEVALPIITNEQYGLDKFLAHGDPQGAAATVLPFPAGSNGPLRR